jgi:hypothetical protein
MSGRMRIAATSRVTRLVKTAFVPRNVSHTRRIQEALKYQRTWLSSMEAPLSERALVRADLLERRRGPGLRKAVDGQLYVVPASAAVLNHTDVQRTAASRLSAASGPATQ